MHKSHKDLKVLLTIISFYLSLFSYDLYGKNSLGLPMIRHYSTETFKGGIQSWQFLQDKRNVLYVANNHGLIEFNGYEWSLFRLPVNTKVRTIAMDDAGTIYVGSQGDFGYFSSQGNGELKYTSLADSLEARHRNINETWRIHILNGHVYFCTFERIYDYYNGKIEVINLRSTVGFAFVCEQKLYINDFKKGLIRLDNGILTPLYGAEKFASMNITALLSDINNRLIVFTRQNGAFSYQNGIIVPWNESLKAALINPQINSAVRMKDGSFAIGTQNNGLIITDAKGNIVYHLDKNKGLENRTITCIYEDHFNNLWVGTNNGIAYIALGAPFTLINEQNGVAGTGYTSHINNNRLYLGTNNGLFISHPRNKNDFELISSTDGQTYKIDQVQNDLLLGHHNGTYRIENEKAVAINNTPGGWTFTQLQKRREYMIEGTYSGLLLYKMINGNWTFKRKIKGFSESSRLLEEDYDGNIWMTHGYKGVYKLKLNEALDEVIEVSFYDEHKGFPSHVLINVYRFNGELVFSAEEGVYQYDSKTDGFVRYKLFDEALNNDVKLRGMKADLNGNIYFHSEKGPGAMILKRNGEYALGTNVFNKIKTMLNDDLNHINILEDNKVIFGAKEGFIIYDPHKRTPEDLDFKAIITQVGISGNQDSVLYYSYQSNSKTNKQSSIDYQYNDISISFSSPYFDSPEHVEYQFLLDGFDEHWSDWTIHHEKEYTNLPEGEYNFKVRAKSIYGKISEADAYAIIIHPPYYRSVVAYIVYAFAVLIILGFLLKTIDNRYQAEQKRLKAQQENELQRKNDKIEHITKSTEEKINQLEKEKLEVEILHMNKELATSTMLIMNKNQFIQHVKGTLEKLKKTVKSERAKLEISSINREIDRNIASDDDWKNFEMHFDRVHGDFSGRIKRSYPKISPQELKLCAYLRMNLSTKEIAQLLNITGRGVEIARYRLRKKLGLERSQNLQEFILGF